MTRRLLPVVLAALLALPLATVGSPAPPASAAVGTTAAAATYSCLPGHGLMSNNTAADLMAGRLALGDGRVLGIGTTGDTVWARKTMDSGATRLLASMSWANVLVRETVRTGNPAYLDRARAFAADFVRDNPSTGGARPGDTWTPMYTGHRTSFLACLSLNRPSDATVTQWLTAHGTYLARPENSGGVWNQGIEAAIGLLGAGCRLSRSDWTSTAATRLGSMITQSIDAQGAVNEQAPGYGAFVHNRWGLAATKLQECGLTPPPAIAQRLPRLLDFLAWSTAGDGRMVQIGDTSSIAPPDVPGTASQYAATSGRQGVPLTGLDAVYDSGYAFGRTSWSPFTTGVHWSLRFGPGRDLHGHEDHQSVTLTRGARPVLVDSGHSGYSNEAWRLWQRSPEAHNVVVMPGLTLTPRTTTALVRSSGGSAWRWYEVTDVPYPRSSRTRGVYVDATLGLMLVQDRVSRPTSGAVQQLWHLPTGTTTTVVGRSKVVGRSADGAQDTVVLQVPLPGTALPRGATSVVTGRLAPMQGWVSRSTGEMKPAPTVVAATAGTSARMITLVVAVPAGTSVSAAAAAAGTSHVVTVDVGGTRTEVGLSRGGGMWRIR